MSPTPYQNADADRLHDEAADIETPQTAQTPPAVSAPLPSPSASQAEPDMAPPVRVVLVRHGVTDFTHQGRLDGRGGADPALNDAGLAQARAAARGVQDLLGDGAGVRVVSSSLHRARQTAQAIAGAFDLQPEVENDLDELCFGEWDGRRVADISRESGEALQRSRSEEDVPPPGGESYAQLAERVLAAFARLVDETREMATDDASATLVVVTHRGPIGCILADVVGMPLPTVWRIATHPCSLTAMQFWRDGGVVVEFVNDTSHLR